MKATLALLFLAALAVFVQAEWASEFHPHAMLEYARGEEHEMKRQLFHLVKMDNGFETSFKREFKPSFEPSFEPSFKPSFSPGVIKCAIQFTRCKKRAANSCDVLGCIKKFGICLAGQNVQLPKPVEESVKECLPLIPYCLKLSGESCDEKLCCFVRFKECMYNYHTGKA